MTRRLLALQCGAFAVLAFVSAFWLGRASTPVSVSSPAPPPPPDLSGQNLPAAPTAPMHPEDAAQAWFAAANSYSWRDTSPTAWIDRARPYLAGPLEQAALDLARSNNGGGADWTALLADHCVQRVAELSGIIPREAPATPTTVWVQVSGTLTQTCEKAPSPPPQPAAATVEITQQPDGTWRVTDQTY